MRPDRLREAVERDLADGVLPVAVVATAGTTNTGAIDPIRALGEIAHEHGVWFHVDGAYGLPGILDERVAHLYDGLELADSAIVDPHKWLNAPMGVAATFVRTPDCSTARSRRSRRRTSRRCSRASPTTCSTRSTAWASAYSEFGVELSSPSRGVVVWSILRELGREGVAARIRDDNGFARQLAEHVRREPHLELLAEPTLSIVCFRYVARTASTTSTRSTTRCSSGSSARRRTCRARPGWTAPTPSGRASSTRARRPTWSTGSRPRRCGSATSCSRPAPSAG